MRRANTVSGGPPFHLAHSSDAILLITRPVQSCRLVAIGDVHGDLRKAKQAFRLAHLIDDEDRWIGGETVVVQVGDLLDRGPAEVAILYFLERIKQEAARTGGAVYVLNGEQRKVRGGALAGQTRRSWRGGVPDD